MAKNKKVKYVYPNYFWVLHFSYPVRRAHWWSIRKDCDWVVVKAKTREHAYEKARKWYDPEHSNWWLRMMFGAAHHTDAHFADYYQQWINRPDRKLNKLKENIQKVLAFIK